MIKFFIPVLMMLITFSAFAGNEEKAYKFVNNTIEKGLGFLSDEDLSQDDKAQSFDKLLKNNFDLRTIGRFSIGRYWRDMNKSQQSEYLTVFGEYVVFVYLNRFDEYQGQKVQLKDVRQVNEKDFLVYSEIIDIENGDRVVPLDWRVRYKNDKFQIIDVIVNDVSMTVTQRSDFSSLIQRNGGDVEALITNLKEKIQI